MIDKFRREAIAQRLRTSPAELPALHTRTATLFEWVGQLGQVSRQEALERLEHLRTLSGYQRVSNPQTQVLTDA